jgi:hypothetical protein
MKVVATPENNVDAYLAECERCKCVLLCDLDEVEVVDTSTPLKMIDSSTGQEFTIKCYTTGAIRFRFVCSNCNMHNDIHEYGSKTFFMKITKWQHLIWLSQIK